MVHLLSALTNFEPPQTGVVCSSAPLLRPEPRPARADLQRQIEFQRQELVERYAAGETVQALAAEFRMHHSTVRATLESAGAVIRRRHQVTREEIARMPGLYEAGQTTTEIGDLLGCDPSTVRRHLLAHGVVLRPAARRKT